MKTRRKRTKQEVVALQPSRGVISARFYMQACPDLQVPLKPEIENRFT